MLSRCARSGSKLSKRLQAGIPTKGPLSAVEVPETATKSLEDSRVRCDEPFFKFPGSPQMRTELLRSQNDDNTTAIQSSFPWDNQYLPAFMQKALHGRHTTDWLRRSPISAHGEYFDLNNTFYSTMQRVIRRVNWNLMDSNIFDLANPSRNLEYARNYGQGQSSPFDNGMGIQYRHFSTSPKNSENDDVNKEDAKNDTADSSSSSASSKTPATPKKSSSVVPNPSASDKAQEMVSSAIKSLTSMIAKTPGILWFYMTHPKEFKEKMIELKEAAKKEAHHYYMGSKLLMADVRTARTIIGQTLQGTPLSRREKKQLLRTVTDVFRLVPMSIFVLIPFMEFALPFALRIFPNMLPSTFQDSLKEEEKMKRELKSRIAMAEFFQE